ncbi:aspartate kinase domain protein, partial [Vibrio parahaemolyticus VPTS-2010]
QKKAKCYVMSVKLMMASAL